MNKDIVSFEGEEKRDGIISMTGCTGISRTRRVSVRVHAL